MASPRWNGFICVQRPDIADGGTDNTRPKPRQDTVLSSIRAARSAGTNHTNEDRMLESREHERVRQDSQEDKTSFSAALLTAYEKHQNRWRGTGSIDLAMEFLPEEGLGGRLED